MKLDHYQHAHQVTPPWGQPTASFQVGTGGVTRIDATELGIVVHATEATKSWQLLLGPGVGYCRGESQAHVCDCGKVLESETSLLAHKRSHKPNHKGAEK